MANFSSSISTVQDLTVLGGEVTFTSIATDVDLIDNSASALSFDTCGKTGIIDIVTTNCSEGVTMSGTLGVTGVLTSTGGITVGVCDTGLDVKFFGASAGAFMLYDQSCDQLEIRGASADAATSTGKLLLTTALTNINACDVIGSINFQAPLEAGGTDATAIAAGIRAVAQATFTCAVNATDLIFYTGHSEAAAERFRFTSQNEIGIAGANYGTDGQVLTSGGAGAAVAWEALPSSGPSQADETALECETNEDTYAPPDLIKHSPGVAKGYGVFVGGDGTEATCGAGSYNVCVGGRSATGKYSITWVTAFADVNYTTVTAAENNSRGEGLFNVNVYAPATTLVYIDIVNHSAAFTDSDYHAVAFGSQ